MNNTLESHKLFPYVAWAVVIGFALFTYNLTLTVRAELELISSGINRIEERIDTIEKTPAPKGTPTVQ